MELEALRSARQAQEGATRSQVDLARRQLHLFSSAWPMLHPVRRTRIPPIPPPVVCHPRVLAPHDARDRAEPRRVV